MDRITQNIEQKMQATESQAERIKLCQALRCLVDLKNHESNRDLISKFIPKTFLTSLTVTNSERIFSRILFQGEIRPQEVIEMEKCIEEELFSHQRNKQALDKIRSSKPQLFPSKEERLKIVNSVTF